MSLDSRLGDTHSNKRNISNVMIGEESFVPRIAAFSFFYRPLSMKSGRQTAGDKIEAAG